MLHLTCRQPIAYLSDWGLKDWWWQNERHNWTEQANDVMSLALHPWQDSFKILVKNTFLHSANCDRIWWQCLVAMCSGALLLCMAYVEKPPCPPITAHLRQWKSALSSVPPPLAPCAAAPVAHPFLWPSNILQGAILSQMHSERRNWTEHLASSFVSLAVRSP
jgi:hypothetical protein